MKKITDKQITIDYENLCANYSKEVGCYNTFDGSCIKEQCFTYRLLQLLQAKEQECEKIKNWVKGMMFYTDCSNWFERFTTAFEDWKNDLISQLDQLKGENVGVLKQLEFVRTLNTVQEAEIRKLSKTLAEIKEIAGHQCNICEALTPVDEYKDCKKCWQGKILQKISKCEVKHV